MTDILVDGRGTERSNLRLVYGPVTATEAYLFYGLANVHVQRSFIDPFYTIFFLLKF